ncbi:hypothetical protein RJ639_018329, partial [Escallonia herrerae]
THLTPKRQRALLCGPLPLAILVSATFFFASAFIVVDYKKGQCRPDGSEALPKGIVSRTSNLEMVFDPSYYRILQFPSTDFVIMLFHYDGIVDEWRDLEWSSRAIHVSALNQTKWWFAKRFLHPDVISEYAYIFLWDEDLGVENFHAGRYLSIVKEEGLHISQPALDPHKSEVHHQMTSRKEGVKLHRRITGLSRSGKRCYENSTDPPCTGWVEMMAPVFSWASWRCAWYIIQNDWIYAWGLDMQLGYCAQGNRTQNIGIIDSEYVVHSGLPTLGGSAENKVFLESGWIHLILRCIEFHLFVSMPASINALPVIIGHSTIKMSGSSPWSN